MAVDPACGMPVDPARAAGTVDEVQPTCQVYNLFLAFVSNTLGVPITAGLLYPFFGLLISSVWASAAMTLSSLSVIANALRLHRVEL